MGLFGCIIFLLSTRLASIYPIVGEPPMMLSLFGICVLLPWLGIVVVYFRCIRSVTITPKGITVATRLRRHAMVWADLDKVCLARSTDKHGNPLLALVLIPKDRTVPPLEIDFNLHSTAIRARSYMVREITRLHAEPQCIQREALGLDRQDSVSY